MATEEVTDGRGGLEWGKFPERLDEPRTGDMALEWGLALN